MDNSVNSLNKNELTSGSLESFFSTSSPCHLLQKNLMELQPVMSDVPKSRIVENNGVILAEPSNANLLSSVFEKEENNTNLTHELDILKNNGVSEKGYSKAATENIELIKNVLLRVIQLGNSEQKVKGLKLLKGLLYNNLYFHYSDVNGSSSAYWFDFKQLLELHDLVSVIQVKDNQTLNIIQQESVQLILDHLKDFVKSNSILVLYILTDEKYRAVPDPVQQEAVTIFLKNILNKEYSFRTITFNNELLRHSHVAIREASLDYAVAAIQQCTDANVLKKLIENEPDAHPKVKDALNNRFLEIRPPVSNQISRMFRGIERVTNVFSRS